MNNPLMGGYFQARANAWEYLHYSARWTPEAPAPPQWAEIDLIWQIDQDKMMSIREFADFLGWKRSRVHTLLCEVKAYLARLKEASDKNRTKTGQTPDSNRTATGQLDKVEAAIYDAKPDRRRTATGQTPDASCARFSLDQLSDSQTLNSQQERESHAPSLQQDTTPKSGSAFEGAHLQEAVPLEAPGIASPLPVSAAPLPIPDPPPVAPSLPQGRPWKEQPSMDTQRIGVVWAGWRLHHPSAGISPHERISVQIKSALDVAPVNDLLLVLKWWHECNDPGSDPVWWRPKSHNLSDVLKGERLDKRIEAAQAWEKRTATGQPLPAPMVDIKQEMGVLFDRLVARKSSGQKPPDAYDTDPIRHQKIHRVLMGVVGGYSGLGTMQSNDRPFRRKQFIDEAFAALTATATTEPKITPLRSTLENAAT